MADRYWWPSGGTGSSTGNWNSTTNWSSSSASYVSAAAPTSTDTANFGSYSGASPFTVTIAATATCSTLVINNANMTLAGTSAWTIYGPVTVTAFASRTYSGAITFSSTTGFASTLNFGPMSLGSAITFNQAGGMVWTLGSAFTTTGSITLTAGTLDTSAVGNYTLTCGNFSLLGTTGRGLNLNASTVNAGLLALTGINSFNCGTSQINITNAASANIGGGGTYYNVSFTNTAISSSSIAGTNTFNNLSFPSKSVAGHTTITLSGSQTINGALTIAAPTTLGSSRYFFRSSAGGTARTINASSISSLTDIDFQDITNPSATWSGTRLGNAGGNTGITFDTPKTVYWNLAAASSAWTANGWATTPTGTPDTINYPLFQDTATFTDNNPASGQTVLGTTFMPSVDFSGRTLPIVTQLNGTWYGDFTLSSAVSFNANSGSMNFAKRGNQYINTNGVSLASRYAPVIDAVTGTVFLNGALTSQSISVVSGGFNTQNYNVSTLSFSVSGTSTRSCNFGSSNITLAASGSTVWVANTTTGLTFNAGTSTLSLTSASAKTFAGGGLTYYNINQGGAGALTISGSSTFNNITNTVQPATVTFSGLSTNTFANFNLNGISGSLITINSSTVGNPAFLVKSGGGQVSCDYISVRDIVATPTTNTWYAGVNSTDIFGNAGWIFTAPPAGMSSGFFLMFP